MMKIAGFYIPNVIESYGRFYTDSPWLINMGYFSFVSTSLEGFTEVKVNKQKLLGIINQIRINMAYD